MSEGAPRLAEIQRQMAEIIFSPLTDWKTSDRTKSGEKSSDIAEEIIKSNDKLSSLERIEIYNKQYWFRLVDIMYEDFPGLHALLGKEDFNTVIFEYLKVHPSRSFTLRNLGAKLGEFLAERPELLGKRSAIVLDMVALHWANIIAFDGPSLPRLTPETLAKSNPLELTLRVQPHISVLALSYPVDKILLRLKKNAMKSFDKRVRVPKLEKIWLVVHRQENSIFHKRIEEPAYVLLQAFQKGFGLEAACEEALPFFSDQNDLIPKIQSWFQTWSMLGWFSMEKAVEEIQG